MNENPPKAPEYSADGVDLSLIRWMLSLTPTQRLAALQKHVNSVMKLRATLKLRA